MSDHMTAALKTALKELTRQAKAQAWNEGFNAGWEECDEPGAFVNDIWDATTPNPYAKETK